MKDILTSLEANGPLEPFSLLFFTGVLLALLLVGADAASVPEPNRGPQRFVGLDRSKRFVGHITAFFIRIFGYALLVAVFDRYLTATALGVVLIVLLWAGNKLKVAVLDEPLVFSDVFLAGHALRYPRLYFGYAPVWIWPLIALAAAVLAVFALQEPSLGIPGIIRAGVPFTLMGVIWVGNEWSRVPRSSFDCCMKALPLTFTANEDARRYTPFGAALLHLLWHSRRRCELREAFRCKPEIGPTSHGGQAVGSTEQRWGQARHLLLVQAESFCRIGQKLDRPASTPCMDALIDAGKGGDLTLDWRGAYTMRTEFAVLTGLSPEATQTYGFDPYRLAALERMNSIARVLKKKGFRTMVWHPNDARFFDRDKVMPNLGFDEFWDLKRLESVYGTRLGKFGRYASDASLLTLAAVYLKTAVEPTFLFVITMEAHGPWDVGNFPGADKVSETERYEAHMLSLDRGVKQLAEEIGSGALSAKALVYGDHIPGIEDLRKEGRNNIADTSWVFISKEPVALLPGKLRPEGIADLFLKASGEKI